MTSGSPEPTALMWIDGASSGNPGPSGIGVACRTPEGKAIFELSQSIGRATNNVAEYTALIRGLEEAAGRGIRHVRVRTDSELLARQMNGRYRVRHAALLPLHEQARRLTGRFSVCTIEHVPREANRDADRLARRASTSAPTGPS